MPHPLPDNNDLRLPFKNLNDITNSNSIVNTDRSIEERTSSMKRV